MPHLRTDASHFSFHGRSWSSVGFSLGKMGHEAADSDESGVSAEAVAICKSAVQTRSVVKISRRVRISRGGTMLISEWAGAAPSGGARHADQQRRRQRTPFPTSFKSCTGALRPADIHTHTHCHKRHVRYTTSVRKEISNGARRAMCDLGVRVGVGL